MLIGVNGTADGSLSLKSPMFGYIAIVVSALGFGTNYLPVKKFNMGDGMFFQWIMCNAILFVGVIVNAAVGSPQFYPLAMLGGSFWAIGNTLAVPAIEAIGVGLGILIWSMANMLFGFATSRFGWFGIPKKIPSKPIMNYIGVAIALSSVLIYAAIKPNQEDQGKSKGGDDDREMESPNKHSPLSSDGDSDSGKGCLRSCKPIKDLPLTQRRILGVVLALLAGSLFGNTFVPTIYIQGWYEGASQEGLDYVFSNFVGIWLASTIIFVVYAAFKRNRPNIIDPTAILPALLSGLLWGCAQAAWFVANAALGEPIAFPIITTIPALLATLCGLIFFKEIKGKRNYLLLVLAFCVTATGVILNALSR